MAAVTEWAPFPGHPDYLISSGGSVKGKRGQAMSLQSGKYVRVNLAKNGKNVTANVHRAVAIAFIPNPKNCPEVNHINSDKHDNRVENLEWVSRKENCQKRRPRECGMVGRSVVQLSLGGVYIRTWPSLHVASGGSKSTATCIGNCCRGTQETASGYRWVYLDDYVAPLDNETWKDVENVKGVAAVSSEGRFRTKTGRITKGGLDTATGYHTIGNNGHYRAHRIVAEAFCAKSDGCDIVNHKNGDRLDNRALNLEWTTSQGNKRHALEEGLIQLRRVRRFHPDGSITDYSSATDASKISGISLGSISQACLGRTLTASGSRWEYLDKQEEFDLSDVYPDESLDPDMDQFIDDLLASL